MPQLGHFFFMKGSIVEGGGGGGVGPDLLFQGTLGQELLYWTPYAIRLRTVIMAPMWTGSARLCPTLAVLTMPDNVTFRSQR